MDLEEYIFALEKWEAALAIDSTSGEGLKVKQQAAFCREQLEK